MTPITKMDSWLKQKRCRVLDGALGTELEKLGIDIKSRLWSGKALFYSPETITQIHSSYIQAGAELILTCTYQLSDQGLKDLGIDDPDVYDRAVKLAKDAVDQNEGENKAKIVGSIGSYGAYLSGGEEYTGEYGAISKSELEEFHRVRLQSLLTNPDVDLIGFETIPNILEAETLVVLFNALATSLNVDKGYYMSFNCREESNQSVIADGTSIPEVSDRLSKLDVSRMYAIGTNCCSISTANGAVELFSKHTNLPLIVYPNSGERYDKTEKKWLPGECDQKITDIVVNWLQLNVKIIGGCCRTNPHFIRQLRDIVDNSSRSG
ncbi:S-adenosylmethionine-homocysteine methyltransferase [Komagataella phaffii GS115]|uniref:S-adenosylmethionine-homocysteine methyltransferase n=2 Tax=Komagataella phaffii TaxID=460519 RepID=C4R8J7_KOMPG|nr:S-adenosylmethionine-homocysteine methyltransferase [Komagataella phaffii GS115]CAY71922.1 S-adenosylmethionine-homocysteine methyltransferase [Komagataella phaffii GS115]